MPFVETELAPSVTSTETIYYYRVDVLPLSHDRAEQLTHPQLGMISVHPVYWFRSLSPLKDKVERIATELLIDPILQKAIVTDATVDSEINLADWVEQANWMLQKQFLPGVTDNLGKTVERSLPLLFPEVGVSTVWVASGQCYFLTQKGHTAQQLRNWAEYTLFNPQIQSVTGAAVTEINPAQWFYFPWVKGVQTPAVVNIPLANLSDDALLQLSQSRCLALSLSEMQVIRDYYARADIQAHRQSLDLPSCPTDVELEIFAQTWSEHCKHKIFAAKIEYTDYSDPDYPVVSTIDSLFKTYIAGATQKLADRRPDLLSVFKDNAGVLQWNDTTAVCFKVETHNSPSALEPYGGALTGIVGVNRDILGTGLGAKPLFNTDVFCFAHPDEPHADRPAMLPASSILDGVRKGVEDGGNKSGIPTVNGALYFDPRYRAKPLVFCGTGGIFPLQIGEYQGFEKYTQPGDIIVMAGGRVGKDGIHGATFSSEAMQEDSPVSAVQIGDPLTQKRLTDFMLAAQQQNLLTGLTDNGAGGLSSSVGEMAQLTNGATIDLETVPLKYPGLAPYEIVISESQERMTFSTRQFEALQTLAAQFDVEIAAIGVFHDEGHFTIRQNGIVVASLDLDFLHNGLPQMELTAEWEMPGTTPIRDHAPENPTRILLELLSSPNICSREALIRQYDHEVQGRSVIKPLMGAHQTAPCDAAVIQPILGELEGLVVSNGLCPQYSDWDTYAMAACAVDEAVRNAVAVGADPKSLALLDNFCWPDPLPSARNPFASEKLAQLVRANQALYDISISYEAPLISGKDSMKNDFDDGSFRLSIPPTLLVSAIGKMPNLEKAVSMEFKSPGDVIFLLGETHSHLGGSAYYTKMGWYSHYCPRVQSGVAKKLYQAVYVCIQQGWLRSCHDASEGGLAVAIAECALGGRYGIQASLLPVLQESPELRWDEALFSETPSRFIASARPEHWPAIEAHFQYLSCHLLGTVTEDTRFHLSVLETAPVIETDITTLREAWRRPPASTYASAVTR